MNLEMHLQPLIYFDDLIVSNYLEIFSFRNIHIFQHYFPYNLPEVCIDILFSVLFSKLNTTEHIRDCLNSYELNPFLGQKMYMKMKTILFDFLLQISNVNYQLQHLCHHQVIHY
jgi:hypothetical protein